MKELTGSTSVIMDVINFGLFGLMLVGGFVAVRWVIRKRRKP